MLKFSKNKEIELKAPMTGRAVNITEVADDVFAKKMVGDGIAIEPTEGIVLAPCDGKVVQIFPTNHAIGLEIKEDIDILIHLGIDTVELKGDGFERLVQEGQIVSVGTPLLKMDLDKVKKRGKHIISPVIITTMDRIQSLEITTGNVIGGKDVIIKIKVKEKNNL